MLEVGTGSGYHAAVLAEVVGAGNVVTVERFPDLARAALARTGSGCLSCRASYLPASGEKT